LKRYLDEYIATTGMAGETVADLTADEEATSIWRASGKAVGSL